MKGPFDLKYLITGAGKEDWFKALGLGSRFLIVLLIVGLLAAGGMTLWRTFFPKPQQNISKPVHVGLLSHDTVDQSTVQNVINPKRKWWEPIPYVAVFGEVKGSSTDNINLGIGVQGGVRWDF